MLPIKRPHPQQPELLAAIEAPHSPIPLINATEAPRPNRRRKLWELPDKHHCPVIGTCLPIGELGRLIRRFFGSVDPRNEHCTRGEVAGALWAAVTHRAISPESEQLVFADIHMLSHQIGAGQAADNRRLARLEQENAALKAALAQQKNRQTARENRLRQQLRKLADERDSLVGLRADVARFQKRLDA